jgi:hypothetical protein
VREQIDGEPMVTRASLTLLPKKALAQPDGLAQNRLQDSVNLRATAFSNAVTILISQAIADGNATVLPPGPYAATGMHSEALTRMPAKLTVSTTST